MELYRTICREAAAEQVIQRSRFLAYIQPVERQEEAETFFARIRAEHKTATHRVPAFLLGAKAEHQWASDDGEPQGTAGPPLLHLFAGEGLTNLAVLVVRYFGGVKLGTGGLARAYSGTARLALEAAGHCRVVERDTLTVTLDYAPYERLSALARDADIHLGAPSFQDRVTLPVATEPEQADDLRRLLAELTAGRFEERSCVREQVKISIG